MNRISPDWIPPMEVGNLKTDVSKVYENQYNLDIH
jgi:hypothetical protein